MLTVGRFFLKSVATLFPNQVHVGFIKFATEVTFADWLPASWSTKEFKQTVPTEFDSGYTNTPAAIEKAIEMLEVGDITEICQGEIFQGNGSREKVAVFITNGLPVVNEETDKQKELSDTKNVISKVSRLFVCLTNSF